MGEVWQLPALEGIQNTGSEWLLHLLQSATETSRPMILMTLWRSWHVRNEVVHDKQPPPLEVSRRLLSSYLESIIQIKYHPNENLEKGKFILHVQGNNLYMNSTDHKQITTASWCPPTPGWCKLNTDGSFGADATSGVGM
jgi:hypothetical protein